MGGGVWKFVPVTRASSPSLSLPHTTDVLNCWCASSVKQSSQTDQRIMSQTFAMQMRRAALEFLKCFMFDLTWSISTQLIRYTYAIYIYTMLHVQYIYIHIYIYISMGKSNGAAKTEAESNVCRNWNRSCTDSADRSVTFVQLKYTHAHQELACT